MDAELIAQRRFRVAGLLDVLESLSLLDSQDVGYARARFKITNVRERRHLILTLVAEVRSSSNPQSSSADLGAS